MYANVAFPFRLSALTYRVPPYSLSELKGRIVKAPIMSSSHLGVVLDVFDEADELDKKNVREIQEVYQRFANDSYITFIKWLSNYYLSPIGSVLKSCFFNHVAESMIKKKSDLIVHNKSKIYGSDSLNSPCRDLSLICDAVREKMHKPFLIHAPSISNEEQFVIDVLRNIAPEARGIIILAPEILQVERLSPILREIFGERLCVFHSRLSKNKIKEALNNIIAGISDVVIGTRSAILTPIKSPSFIAVTSEHSLSYKGEEGIRYNARDVAVMRGFLEKSCVLLSSICPSVESFYNTKIGKYNLTPSVDSVIKNPRVKIADIKKEKKAVISSDIIKELKNIASKGGNIVIITKREGYSLLICEDCGYIYRCERCDVPFIFHKISRTVKCHYCGQEKRIPENCKECESFKIKQFGAGTERIKEELANVLKSESMIVEKERGLPFLEQGLDVASFVIGTHYSAKSIKNKNFDAAVLLNIDSLLSQPDFRAYERTFQEVIQIKELVKPEGTIYLQTWNPKNKILKFIKNYDFNSFYDNELYQRKLLSYPPFSRIILLNIFMKRDPERFLHDINKIICDTKINGLEFLGPLEVPSSLKSFAYCIQILIKSGDRRLLHNVAKDILRKLEKIKGIKINVDVDPLKI